MQINSDWINQNIYQFMSIQPNIMGYLLTKKVLRRLNVSSARRCVSFKSSSKQKYSHRQNFVLEWWMNPSRILFILQVIFYDILNTFELWDELFWMCTLLKWRRKARLGEWQTYKYPIQKMVHEENVRKGEQIKKLMVL